MYTYTIYHNSTYCIPDDVVSYQTNCSDSSRVGVTCDINGYQSTVSKYLICLDEDITVCDDQIEKKCISTIACKVHKHQMCDNNKDCDDEFDETHHICRSVTKETCERRVGKEGELPIPISWLGDGVKDCVDGADETAVWPMCGIGKTQRYVSDDKVKKEKKQKDNKVKCENVFICRWGNPGFVELSDLCDGIETCGNENKICSVSSRSQNIATSVSTANKGLTKQLSFCVRGLRSLQLLKDTCIKEQFIFPDHEFFGVETKTSVFLPNNTQTCDHMYGELYLYTSCTDRCISAPCPLRNIPRYEVCPDQFPDRVGTIANNEYLAFFIKSYGNIYTNRYFVCDGKKTA